MRSQCLTRGGWTLSSDKSFGIIGHAALEKIRLPFQRYHLDKFKRVLCVINCCNIQSDQQPSTPFQNCCSSSDASVMIAVSVGSGIF